VIRPPKPGELLAYLVTLVAVSAWCVALRELARLLTLN